MNDIVNACCTELVRTSPGLMDEAAAPRAVPPIPHRDTGGGRYPSLKRLPLGRPRLVSPGAGGQRLPSDADRRPA